MAGEHFSVAIELDGDGWHPAAWRAAAHDPAALLDPRRWAQTVLAAQGHGFTAVTIDDSPLPPAAPPGITARLDAIQRAAFVAPLTSAIGLIPVASVSASEPFHVATQLASLDYASRGRAGWIVRAVDDPAEARAYGREPLAPGRTPWDEAADAIEVARRLWDSWEDDAVVKDAATGRYLDRDKLHYADFEGPAYSVKGPSIIPRPLQGQLVVAAPEGLADPAKVETVLVSGSDADALLASAERARVAGAQRVVAEIAFALDSRGVSAERRIAELDRHAPSESGGGLRHLGTAEDLAVLIAGLADTVDGVRLHPAVVDVDLDEAGRRLLPALREGIGFRSPAPGTTLRESLGLARPANRYERSVA